ncbi:MAG: DUF6231 family protein [Cellvibrionaceae bacterium]
MLPQDALWNQLQQHQPKSLLIFSDAPIPALIQWCQENQCDLTHMQEFEELDRLGRVDLAIVLDWQPHSGDSAQLLARLRNLHSHKIWLLTPSTSQHPDAQLLGLGFQRQHCFDKEEMSSYGYNLDHYNRRREWNTPKHWANPENWGKYWW